MRYTVKNSLTSLIMTHILHDDVRFYKICIAPIFETRTAKVYKNVVELHGLSVHLASLGMAIASNNYAYRYAYKQYPY